MRGTGIVHRRAACRSARPAAAGPPRARPLPSTHDQRTTSSGQSMPRAERTDSAPANPSGW